MKLKVAPDASPNRPLRMYKLSSTEPSAATNVRNEATLWCIVDLTLALSFLAASMRCSTSLSPICTTLVSS